jgi:hypothetical protein
MNLLKHINIIKATTARITGATTIHSKVVDMAGYDMKAACSCYVVVPCLWVQAVQRLGINRIHKTLRVTPAMEAKISDHVWSLEELYD